MPIQVLTPAQGEAVGPGTIIRASTLSVLPVGHHWDALVFESGKQDTLGEAVHFVEGQSADFTLGVRSSSSAVAEPIWLRQPAAAAAAGEFTMTVRVISAQSTILDTSGPIGIQWRPDPAGAAYVQSLTTQGTTDGSFTAADRQALQVVQASVVSSLPLNTSPGSLVDLGVDALQSGPPHELLGTSSDFILSGRGSIDRPSGSTGIYAYGCRWTLEAAPLGLGKVEGVVNEYEQRIVQFALIKGSAGGFEYIDQLVNDHMGGGQMNWGIPFPKRLEYFILPFCTLRFRWLLFLQAP